MYKVFNYVFATGTFGDECDGDDWEFEPETKDLENAIVNELVEQYFSREVRNSFTTKQRLAIEKAFKNFIDDNDELSNDDTWQSLADYYEEELKDFFGKMAYEEYNEKMAERR